jgi:3-oxoacyl-[acyl-carrier-protein] synthase II
VSAVTSREPIIVGLGVADAAGLRGTACSGLAWAGERDPLTTAGIYRRVTGRIDPTFRRIDRMSRAFVLAAEAAGLAQLDDALRAETALVVETERGCLESDLEFEASLSAGMPFGPVFPYTLPSTCLGELALRHGLRGPSLCLSTAAGERGVALREARALLELGEARRAIAASVEVLAVPHGAASAALLAVVVIVAPHGTAGAHFEWPRDASDPFTELLSRIQ